MDELRPLKELEAALALYAGWYGSGDLQQQRDAVAASVLAVARFLEGEGVHPMALAPLLRPVEALSERENNRLDPMFAEALGQSARPKKSMRDRERTGILAAFAEAWLRSHPELERSQKEKLGDLARKLNGPWFGGIGQVSAGQLRYARESIFKRHPGNARETATVFYTGIVRAAELVGPENAFTWAVRLLNETPATNGIGQKIPE